MYPKHARYQASLIADLYCFIPASKARRNNQTALVPPGGVEPLSTSATVLQTADPPGDLVRRVKADEKLISFYNPNVNLSSIQLESKVGIEPTVTVLQTVPQSHRGLST